MPILGIAAAANIKNFLNQLVLLASRLIGYTNVPGTGTGYYTTMVGSASPGYVAVANGNSAAYSTDGITWTASTMSSSTQWSSITYGDGKFAALATSGGGNSAAYSTDGVNWTASTLPSNELWLSITYGGGKFVEVADGSQSHTA